MAGRYEVLILITGDPVPEAERSRGNFAEMIRRLVPDASRFEFRDIDVRRTSLDSIQPNGCVIVTGSPSSVTQREIWMEATAARLRKWVEEEVPILGICFGHQLLAHALGGSVQVNPRGREIGSVEMKIADAADPVVGSGGSYLVNASHVDSVVELPVGARVLAHTKLEPHAALLFSPNVWGVQFHPEIDGHIMSQYVMARADVLRQEGLDPDACLSQIREAPKGAAAVPRFLHHVAPESGAGAIESP